jgi:hypothetical protein
MAKSATTGDSRWTLTADIDLSDDRRLPKVHAIRSSQVPLELSRGRELE